ncbi:hypothetical protein BH11VER1_BH11VER1_01850 [soil metagenome]
MEIVHRVFSNKKPELKALVDRLMIPHTYTDNIVGQVVSFEILESDPKWVLLEEHLGKFDTFHTVGTQFSRKEIMSADWLFTFVGTYQYPQPEENWGHDSYDESNSCSKCHVGISQSKPIRLKSDFKQKNSAFFGLFWSYDVVLTRPHIIRILKEAFGAKHFNTLPVIHHKSGIKFEDLVQIVIPILETDLIIDDEIQREHCAQCGSNRNVRKERGMVLTRGVSPQASSPIYLTKEWFGSGGSSHRQIVVSNDFMDFVTRNKLRGFSFEPFNSTPKS